MPFSPESLAMLDEHDRKVREAFNRGIAQAYLKEYQKAICYPLSAAEEKALVAMIRQHQRRN